MLDVLVQPKPQKQEPDELRDKLQKARDALRTARSEVEKAVNEAETLRSELADLGALEDCGDISKGEAKEARTKIEAARAKAWAEAERAAAALERHEASVKLYRHKLTEAEAEQKAELRKEIAQEALDIIERLAESWTEAGDSAIELRDVVNKAGAVGLDLPSAIVPFSLFHVPSAGPGVVNYEAVGQDWRRRLDATVKRLEKAAS